MPILNRRLLVLAPAAALLFKVLPATAATPVFYRNPGCGCCHVWLDRMKEAGFDVGMEDHQDLTSYGLAKGIPVEMQGCHIGEIDGYVISGHVPPADIRKLLENRPAARGLLVPGMPVGSPGMEMDGQIDRYDVLLLSDDGKTSVFASYG